MFSQLDGFGGNFGISIPNFRGAGQELDASVEYATRYRKFSFGFTEPWAFDTPTRLSGNIFYRWQDYDGEEYQSFGLELGAGRRLKWPDDYFSAYLNYRLSHEDVTRSIDTVGNMIFLDEGLLSRLRFTLERNDTDVPMFPNSGSIFFLTTEMAGLGGDYNYLKATTGYNWYFPLWWKLVLSTKTKFGLLGGFQDMQTLLLTDVFAAGDVLYDGVIRGYPQEFGGVRYPEQGVAMFTLSTELRFPILERQMYFRVFGDMGNTWSDIAQIDLTDMYKGVGFGVSLLFPMIGLLDFDFAWGLDSPPRGHMDSDEPRGFMFHFNMGKGY
jgi:outer membrane protein insertion porin family